MGQSTISPPPRLIFSCITTWCGQACDMLHASLAQNNWMDTIIKSTTELCCACDMPLLLLAMLTGRVLLLAHTPHAGSSLPFRRATSKTTTADLLTSPSLSGILCLWLHRSSSCYRLLRWSMTPTRCTRSLLPVSCLVLSPAWSFFGDSA